MAVFVTGHHADPVFTPTGAGSARYPHLLDADNLSDAASTSSRLERDDSGRTPLPLLRIDTTSSAPAATCARRDRQAIAFPDSPRLLAGLIADAVRVGVASGAVITVGGRPTRSHRLRDEIADHLLLAGFDVAFDVPGWAVEDTSLQPSS
ncbi:hypothetical protein [Rhodococcus sp. NPDC127528]|uniref:hypothetical protein n=1 Tax=unclassified Rhodococcus (in: high G+C Gram-positive bacteria) TaxID=192944 RepID=UPI00363B1033